MAESISKLQPKQYVKLKLPAQVDFASDSGILATLEGNVAYQAGDALMTGIQGEHWPITRAKFDLTYDPVPPTLMGEAGTYLKKKLVVEAEQMNTSFEVSIRGGTSVLKGNASDWVVTSPDGSKWVVADSIFTKTYGLVSE